MQNKHKKKPQNQIDIFTISKYVVNLQSSTLKIHCYVWEILLVYNCIILESWQSLLLSYEMFPNFP